MGTTEGTKGYLKVFIIDLIRKVKSADLPSTGAMLAYFLLFSIFPFLIFLLNIIALTASGHNADILEAMNYLPNNVSIILLPVINSLIRASSGTLLSVSLVLALWAGSNGIVKLMREVNHAFGVKQQRNLIAERLLGIVFTLALAVLITLMMLSNVFGNVILGIFTDLFGENPYFDKAWGYFRSFVPLFFIIFVFAMLYRISPNLDGKHKVLFRDVIPGAVFTSMTWISITIGFSYYIDNFGHYDKTYGSLGGIIVLMMWLYISSMIMILGAYVSSSYISVKRKKDRDHSIYGTVKRMEL